MISTTYSQISSAVVSKSAAYTSRQEKVSILSQHCSNTAVDSTLMSLEDIEDTLSALGSSNGHGSLKDTNCLFALLLIELSLT